MRETMLPPEGFRYIQKHGRSCQGLKPYCMLYNTKTQGGIAVSLAYSGNWQIEVTPQGDRTVLRVATSPSQLAPFESIGASPFPGPSWPSFPAIGTTAPNLSGGSFAASCCEIRAAIGRPCSTTTGMALRAISMRSRSSTSAAAAADVGCELFTVDAGWYGGQSGGDWNQALGDWTVNRQKLPGGLEGIAREARRRGMKFGLWIEIECAGPNAPIARQHPEWYLREGNRQLSNRGVLDFGNPQVLAWATSVIDGLMARYNLDYLKMDFNTDPAVDGERNVRGADPLYGHYRGLVQLWKHLRRNTPGLSWRTVPADRCGKT